MQTISEIRTILAERGLRPRHRLGQNFLHDKNQITRLVEAAGVRRREVVLEVGPGTGTLTEALLERGAVVIACEIDADLAAIVRERLCSPSLEGRGSGGGSGGDHGGAATPENAGASPTPLPPPSEGGGVHHAAVTVIEGDCLTGGRALNPEIVEAIAGRPFKLVANLPYQVASPLMSTLLIEHENCVGQFVTIQKEVADRLLAKPGTKEYGPLGIIVQAFAEVKRIGTVPPTCFWPQPKVTSAMVGILPLAPGSAGGSRTNIRGAGHGVDLRSIADRRAFARFVTTLFSKRRKQLGTIFGRDRVWPAGITPDQRPEALTVQQLIELLCSVAPSRLPSSLDP